MTDLRKAAEMALEALEANDKLINGTKTHGGLVFAMDGYYSGTFDIDETNQQTEQAITALRQALAQPVDAVYISAERVHKTEKSIHEPVKWVGLTDEEIMQPWPDEEKHEFVIMFAKWVEAKLKEKNT